MIGRRTPVAGDPFYAEGERAGSAAALPGTTVATTRPWSCSSRISGSRSSRSAPRSWASPPPTYNGRTGFEPEGVSVPIAAREEIEAAFDGAAERYRAQGLVADRPTLVTSEALGERLVSVDVRWDYLDEEGRSAQQNGYRYLLRLEDGEASPEIQVVIGTRKRKRTSEKPTYRQLVNRGHQAK